MRDNCNFYKDQKSYSGIVKAMYKAHEDRGLSMDTDAFKYKKAYSVVMTFTGNQTYVTNKRITFRDDSQVSGSTIKGIELLGTTELAHAPTNPLTDIPQTEFAKGFLVLVDDCDMEMVKIPLTTLCRTLNGNTVPMFNVSNINWSACYVRFNDNAGLSAANSLLFNIYI